MELLAHWLTDRVTRNLSSGDVWQHLQQKES